MNKSLFKKSWYVIRFWFGFSCYSQQLGFIYESANKGIVIEDIDLDQVCLLTEAIETRQLISELILLSSERFIAASQGKSWFLWLLCYNLIGIKTKFITLEKYAVCFLIILLISPIWTETRFLAFWSYCNLRPVSPIRYEFASSHACQSPFTISLF